MRHPVLTAAVAAAAVAAVAFGPSTGPITSTPDVAAGGFTGGPVEYVGTLPLDAGLALGATVHEDLYFVTTPRSLTIFDTSNLTAGMPTLVSTTVLQGVAFNEEPRTDGERLLMYDDNRTDLHLFDVSDPANPVQVNVFDTGTRQHTWACVNVTDCSIVYSSNGMMLDITDMENPVVLGDWNDVPGVEVEPNAFHAIDEVAPGIVFVGTEPLYLLDAREDPSSPTLIASGRMDEVGMPLARVPVTGNAYLASRVEWPERTDGSLGDVDEDLLPTHDRWGVVSVETPFAADCSENSGPLLSYDMDRVEEDGTFAIADTFRISDSGLYVDGRGNAHTIGCFPFAFEPHPAYSDNRVMAVAWTEHGTRFFTIGEDDGAIEEIGWFVPLVGGANDPEWIAEDLVAVTDTVRGVDILKVDLAALDGEG